MMFPFEIVVNFSGLVSGWTFGGIVLLLVASMIGLSLNLLSGTPYEVAKRVIEYLGNADVPTKQDDG
jgi:hypothetical protein